MFYISKKKVNAKSTLKKNIIMTQKKQTKISFKLVKRLKVYSYIPSTKKLK